MKKYGFSKTVRLRKTAEFQAVWKDGIKMRGEHLLLAVRPNGLKNSRLGISVSKKKMKRAVDRNRFKRLVREAFRLHRSELPESLDYVVVPNRGDVRLRFEEVRNDLLQLGAKISKKIKT